MTYPVIYLPKSLQQALSFDNHPRLYSYGMIADDDFEGTWISTGDRRYLLVNWLVNIKKTLSLGDRVNVRFRVDDFEDKPLPSALSAALAIDQAAKLCWDSLSQGRRRNFARHVFVSRDAETEKRRVADVLALLPIDGKRPARVQWNMLKKAS